MYIIKHVIQNLLHDINYIQDEVCLARGHLPRKVTLYAFLDTEGASDGTSCNIAKAAKWHGLGDTL